MHAAGSLGSINRWGCPCAELAELYHSRRKGQAEVEEGVEAVLFILRQEGHCEVFFPCVCVSSGVVIMQVLFRHFLLKFLCCA